MDYPRARFHIFIPPYLILGFTCKCSPFFLTSTNERFLKRLYEQEIYTWHLAAVISILSLQWEMEGVCVNAHFYFTAGK